MFFFGNSVEIFSLNWWGFILGGLGIFLLGITFLGEGLKKIAGQKLKILIDKFTSNPIKGVFVGALVTVLMQSSSATTAMTIGFVKAGLMSLPQAVGVIMGANIGTTVTSFIIGLNISSYAPFFLLVGSLLYLFGRKQISKHIGEAVFGFGALFFGLYLMETSLKPMAKLPEFINLVSSLESRPLLGVLIGTVGTAAIQSSSAFIGILQGLISSSESFLLVAALPILFGSNIGTTITAVFASFGSSTAAKRASLIHIVFNVTGTIIFMILLKPYSRGIEWFSGIVNADPKMQIALAHIIFNIATTALILPFTYLLVKMATKLIPDSGKDVCIIVDLHELERDVVELAPSTALEIAKKQVINIGNMAIDGVVSLSKYIVEDDIVEHDRVYSLETSIDHIYEKVSDFLNSMRRSVLEERDVILYSQILHVMKDIERISDHSENLVEYFDEAASRGEKVNTSAKEDIIEMLQIAKVMVEKSIKSFEVNDINLAKEVINQDDELDLLNKNYIVKHIERFREGTADQNRFIALVFVDIIANIERIGDHAVNIADAVVDLIENR
ncbi:MAG: Na/Pi cotransporter family protein [Bacilli bacterium]